MGRVLRERGQDKGDDKVFQYAMSEICLKFGVCDEDGDQALIVMAQAVPWTAPVPGEHYGTSSADFSMPSLVC